MGALSLEDAAPTAAALLAAQGHPGGGQLGAAGGSSSGRRPGRPPGAKAAREVGKVMEAMVSLLATVPSVDGPALSAPASCLPVCGQLSRLA